jgi:hypothetical protein
MSRIPLTFTSRDLWGLELDYEKSAPQHPFVEFGEKTLRVDMSQFKRLEPDAIRVETVPQGDYLVSWPLIETQLNLGQPKDPDFEEVLRRNRDMDVRFYGGFGYSCGRFHELRLSRLDRLWDSHTPGVDITFGQATPLFRLFYERYFEITELVEEDEDAMIDLVHTVRLLGVCRDDLELYLGRSLMAYEKKWSQVPRLVTFEKLRRLDTDSRESSSRDEELQNAELLRLRCYYHACHTADPAMATLQFYRVLESRALEGTIQEVNQRECAEKTRTLISRLGERRGVRKQAQNDGVLGRSQDLGCKLQHHRNQIVHTRLDRKPPAVATPLLTTISKDLGWRRIAHRLAQMAIEEAL